MKKILSLFFMLSILVTAIAGCGSEKISSLEGSWAQTNAEESYFEAIIADSNITIYLKDSVTGTKSLYWKGTYTAPSKAGSYSWTSEGDIEAMSESLLGSQDSTKIINYKDGKIMFDMIMLGTTKTIELKKEN